MGPVIMNTQLTALRELSSCDAGKGTQVELSKLHELRKQSWDSEKSKQMETMRQSAREKRAAEKKNPRDMQRVPLSLGLSIDLPKHAWKLLETRERTTQKD